MRRSRNDFHSFLTGKARNNTSKGRKVLAGLFNIRADAGADLDHRLDHLRLYLLAEKQFALFQNLRNMRFQLARYGIYDLELFLNA